MRAKLMVVLLLGVGIPTTAEEEWFRVFGPSGNAFIVECKAAKQKVDNPSWEGTKQEAHDSGFCMGLITGIAETMSEKEGVDFSDSAITRDQLVRVVQKYMENHPEQLSKPASWLIRQALIKAFPAKH